MSNRMPNFFIVGGPKCGTTALSEYLRTHESIFLSEPKEPHYFNLDFANRHATEWSEYRSYFAHVGDECDAVGEASVFYLRSEVAVREIEERLPGSRYIAMLRNPLEMAPACHSQALRSHGETITGFQKAWEAEPARALGKKLPRACLEPKTIRYRELCSLGEQVERLLGIVPRERVMLIRFDDFRADTLLTYQAACRFLGVPPDDRLQFPRINENVQLRSQWLHRAANAVGEAKARLRIDRGLGIVTGMRERNARQIARGPLPVELRSAMAQYFRDDVRKLERLTGWDLNGWLGGPA